MRKKPLPKKPIDKKTIFTFGQTLQKKHPFTGRTVRAEFYEKRNMVIQQRLMAKFLLAKSIGQARIPNGIKIKAKKLVFSLANRVTPAERQSAERLFVPEDKLKPLTIKEKQLVREIGIKNLSLIRQELQGMHDVVEVGKLNLDNRVDHTVLYSLSIATTLLKFAKGEKVY